MTGIKSEKIPGWAVGVLVVAGVLAVGGVAFVAYKAFKKLGASKDERETKKEVSNELTDVVKSGINPSWPDTVYNSSADFIAQKLDGCETSTTELDVVKEVLRVVKNQADWLKLIKAFGSRDIDNCGPFTGSTKYDNLSALLKDQLDSHVILVKEKVGNNTYSGAYPTFDLLSKELTKKGIKF